MLYVNYRKHGYIREDTLEWHVGELSPKDQIDEEELEEIISIYADSQEKEHILATMKGIPYTEKYSCVWRGDIARFIFDNMTP